MNNQIYSKKDIVENNFKLVLIDSNFLSMLRRKINNINDMDEIRNLFILNKLRPVLYELIFYEFIQGLDKSDSKYINLIKTKKSVIKFLEELGTLWILDINNILEIELFYISLHDPYAIFCSTPTEITKQKQYEFRIPMKPLIMDENIGFYYYSYTDWISYFDYLINGLTPEIKSDIDAIKQKLVSQFEYLLNREGNINDEKQNIINHIRAINANVNAEEIYHIIMTNLSFSSIAKNAPLYSIMHFGRTNTLKTHWNTERKKKQKENDVLDNLHSYIALAYCDYFITDDSDIKKKCDEIAEALELNLTTFTFDKFNEFFARNMLTN